MKTREQINSNGNAFVKLCQTCGFFESKVFSHTIEDYWSEELGVFDLWVWNGYCINPLNPPRKELVFYRETSSKNKCDWYLTKDQYKQFLKYLGDGDYTKMDFMHALARFKHEHIKERETCEGCTFNQHSYVVEEIPCTYCKRALSIPGDAPDLYRPGCKLHMEDEQEG
jgi:hypothetical protein